ncbi:hypothetical protein BDC45DRAFT_506972 [Circinella umbellata]|nr:hypothetical protein BDC45DRAFT_506972 [Circinella umbellata]
MNPTTITNNSTSRFCSDCKCIRLIEFDVGKAIPAGLLITMSKAIELISSRYYDDEGMEMDSNRVGTRDDRSISYSVDAYISFDESMRPMDDQKLDTRLKYCHSFVFHCSQDADTQQQVSDDRRKRIRTRMETYNCGGFIRGLIERRFEYVHINIEHSTGHRAAPVITENTVDENIRTYIQQNCARMDAKDLYHDILGRFPGVLGRIQQSQVYYWWNRSFEDQYRLHRDQFISAGMLLHRAVDQGVIMVS